MTAVPLTDICLALDFVKPVVGVLPSDRPVVLTPLQRRRGREHLVRRRVGLWVLEAQQAEIVKRLNAICAQVIPFLSQEHQQQVVQAVERAKQVTMAELNAIIGHQQLQAQQLSHSHALPVPLTPHPAGLPPGLGPGAGPASLLALTSALGHQLPLKDERKHPDSSAEHQKVP
ncbi:unnamed protein product [Arctogadus glacialis]